MATSSRLASAGGAVAVALLAVAVAAALLLSRGGSGNAAAPAPEPSAGALLASLRPAPAPSGWPAAAIPSGAATLHRPPAWSPVEGDSGTISFALRDAEGRYLGYLNVTPRQGGERLQGWAAFRLARNREEGDRGVRELAAREGVAFAGARGSCVIDDYASRRGGNLYRELACIVRGPRTESVLIAAALQPDWPLLAPSLTHAAEAFVER